MDPRSSDRRDDLEPEQMDALEGAFSAQLEACLEECARGRQGLFGEPVDGEQTWPEAARLRELAIALQAILAQQDQRSALCDEFLDLCSMHGESHPGERRLARLFLDRIERGQVGSPTQDESARW